MQYVVYSVMHAVLLRMYFIIYSNTGGSIKKSSESGVFVQMI